MKLQKIEATGKPYNIYAEYLESEAINQFVATMQQEPVVPCDPWGNEMEEA